MAEVEHLILPADTFSALAERQRLEEIPQPEHPDVAGNFVPGRNLIFFTYAAAYAWPRGIRHIVGGMTRIDRSSFPDSKPETLEALEKAVSLGMAAEFTFHAPLSDSTKVQTLHLARKLGAWEALAWTHTCYRGTFPPCRHCPPCRIRHQAFKDAGFPDPLLERAQIV